MKQTIIIWFTYDVSKLASFVKVVRNTTGIVCIKNCHFVFDVVSMLG